jgi:copper chaperone NosL
MIVASALLLGLTFLFPLWRIELWAPQYPEGLYMDIWSSKITGDFRNINILNHYIGMKAIEPEGIAELKYFPLILGLFMASGLAIAALGRRLGLYIWATVLMLFATGAFYDFYLWGYEYGHELSPDAAIKLEGMSYSPPLIGSKEILNISAGSWPALGGIGVAIAIGLTAITVFLELRTRRHPLTGTGAVAAIPLILALLPMTSCTNSNAVPIEWGTDACHHCKMTLSDRRFGGEVVTDKGKTYLFDSLECLLRFTQEKKLDRYRVFVPDTLKTGELIAATDAKFVISNELRSPMGLGILASNDGAGLGRFPNLRSQSPVTWHDLTKILEKERL